jgi:hypothetical protein
MKTRMVCKSAMFVLPLFSAVLFSPSANLAQTAGVGIGGVPRLFHTADRCMACHNQLTAPSGEDVSIGFDWRSSMMGNAGRDPYWQAAVRRETIDHPAATDAIEDKCTICHLTMARAQAVAEGGQGRAFENFPGAENPGPDAELAADGVSCTTCHQIQDRNLGEKESFTGGFSIDATTPMGQRGIYGPFQVDQGRSTVMSSSSDFHPVEGPHMQSSEFCATCHTVFTHGLGPDGEELGELPEQVPYLEWRHSEYAGTTTCQDCHMPVIEGEVSVTGVLPNPRERVNRHTFRGGNFFMPRLLNRYRAQLGVRALPQELDATAGQAAENLGMRTASVGIESAGVAAGELEFQVTVENLAGHKLPSAYPSRRAWIHVTVEDSQGRSLFESGALESSGLILGNDNDSDPGSYEPHYQEITQADQVQIYEDIMVDHAGEVTTGLLSGVRYVKDNRLLPDGFDKATASEDLAVHGMAAADDDFTGGIDRVRYRVAVGGIPGPLQLEVELWYQPIGYRWVRNLEAYDGPEPQRFVSYFDSMSAASAALLARSRMTVR